MENAKISLKIYTIFKAINRKYLFLALGLFIFFSISSAEAFAAARTVTGEEAERIRSYLEWSHWNPQGGKKDGRHIYILAAPLCGRCTNIAKQSSAIDSDVEIRWIFSFKQLEGAGFLHTAPMPQAYQDFLSGKRINDTPLESMMYQYNQMCQYISGVSFEMTPLIAFSTAEGIRLIETYDVNDIIKELGLLIPVENKVPLALPYLEEINTASLENPSQYVNSTQKPQDLYMLPDKDSPVFGDKGKLLPNDLYNKSWRHNDAWIKLDAFPGQGAWKPFLLHSESDNKQE